MTSKHTLTLAGLIIVAGALFESRLLGLTGLFGCLLWADENWIAICRKGGL